MSRTEGKPSAGLTAADGGDDASKKSTSHDQKSRGGGTNIGKPLKIPYLEVAMVATIIGLVASKLVPQGDLLFAVFTSVYIYIFSRVVFPPLKSTTGIRMFPESQFFVNYILSAAVLGLLLPAVLILISWFDRGDQTAARDAAPHLFLLCCQVLSELLTTPTPFSLPIIAMVPIMYNARRIITLWTWTAAVLSRDRIGLWGFFEQSVTVVNILFWNFNFWAFLLPMYLPWVFRTHYAAENQRQE